jgi:hypothetical protein
MRRYGVTPLLCIWLLLQIPCIRSYDEIETQLQRFWRHSNAVLDTSNQCIRESLQFANEAAEDVWLANFVKSVPEGGGGGVTLPRMKATVILSKAALVLPIIGDLVETGVNTGTSSCLMMRMMMRFDNCNRRLWAFDSFEGLPKPTGEDGVWGMGAHKGQMAVSQELFETNMKRWGAWNETRIVVTKGFFNETLPSSHIGKISFLRLDGDLFASTWDALTNLYHKVVPGGFVYVDDFGSFEGCREAIDSFRTKHHIYEPLHFVREENQVKYIMFEAVWWQKRLVA